MTRILLIGYDPDSVDLTNPALPPGLTADRLREGIARGLQLARDRGWKAEFLSLTPDGTVGSLVEQKLRAETFDCVVIGGGIRLPADLLVEFEAVVNAVHRTAPATPIAFNTRPEDTADAAARWVVPAS